MHQILKQSRQIICRLAVRLAKSTPLKMAVLARASWCEKGKDNIKYGALPYPSIESIQVQDARLYHATFVCRLDKVFMQSHEGGELPLPFPAQTPFGSDSV